MKSVHILIILSLITFSIQLTATICPIIKCSDPKKVKENGTCYAPSPKDDVKIYEVGLCPSGESCPTDREITEDVKKCIKEEDIVRKDLVDSEYCYKNEDCASNNCYDHACIGKANGKECRETQECGLKLFCNSLFLCQEQIPINHPTIICHNDSDCQNNAGCSNGKCVQYFSIEQGEEAPGSKFCKSGFSNKLSGLIRCAIFERVEPLECQPEQTECNYKAIYGGDIPIQEFKQPCKCSYAYSDKKFCQLDSKDELMKEYLETLIKYYDEETFEYHTLQRDISTNPNMRSLMYQFEAFPQLYEADECAIKFSLNGSMIKVAYMLMMIGLFLF